MKPSKPKIDADLLLRSVNEKDAKGWNALFDYFYPQLCSYAGRMLNSAEEAEDCVQEVFLYLWNEKIHFDSLEGLTYFAYRATHNQALMRIRHEKRRAVHLQRIGEESSGEADDLFAKIVREEHERGCTVLIACHNEPMLEVLFERGWRMADGHVVEEVDFS